MKIFVTGAMGFVGQHFAKLALAEGHDVVAFYRTQNSELRTELEREFGSSVEFVEGDVTDPGSLNGEMAGADCVCHFASAFTESGVPDEYFESINVAGTENAVAAAARNGVRRFVYCGTAGVYGQKVEGVVTEDSPVNPWNVYERSKVKAEEVVRTRAPELGLEYVILRPSAVYGPKDNRLEKLYSAASKGRFPLFGPGEGRRHMIYVSDLARAFLRACTEQEASGQELIVAGPRAVPLREMLQQLADCLGRPTCGPKLPLRPMLVAAAVTEDLCKFIPVDPPIYRRRMDFYRNDIEFDCSKAQQVLNWAPQVDLEEGFRQTLEARNGSS